uniref:hypothetical protein n=1 Tax=Candidatus Limisoma sp. TaxID=3076476 RepID=UPI003FED8FEC
MKHTTAAIIVASLFNLSSCHSHRAVESTAGLHTHTETADSVAATRRISASAKEASETVEINFSYSQPATAKLLICRKKPS